MSRKKKYEDLELEYYVLNWDINANKVINFNIFENWLLEDAAIEAADKLLEDKFTFDEFKEDLRKSIMWQEWSRVEYEIYVGRPFEDDANNLEKWDCYSQALPNLDMIARYVARAVREKLYGVE